MKIRNSIRYVIHMLTKFDQRFVNPPAPTPPIEAPSIEVPLESQELPKFATSPTNDMLDYLKSSGHSDLDWVHNFNQRARDNWVAAKAKSVPAGARVLDVGAGTAPYRALFSHCQFETHDFGEYENYKDGSEGIYSKLNYVSDVCNIPAADQSFDVILCTEVLEHVPYPIDALAEMCRLVKVGGRLLLTAPLGSGLHQQPFHFYGGYTDHWYRKFLTEFGCEITSIDPNHGYFAHLAQECARFSWTYAQHKDFHDKHGPELSGLMGDTLARYFFDLDKKAFIREFTIGFQVDARRISSEQVRVLHPFPADRSIT